MDILKTRTHTHARSYTRIEMLNNITQCKYLATMMNEESDKLAYTATTIKLTFEILLTEEMLYVDK